MSVLIAAAKGILRILYFFIKCLPTKEKITFISRQADQPGVDFQRLEKELKQNYPQYQIVMLTRKMPDNLMGILRYGWHMLRQMIQIATSKVVILDSYCIAVSILRHKKSLKVIQMWHALGAFKKFGYSVVDKPEGSSALMAKALHMHHNYDYAVVSGPKCVSYFSEAFHLPKERFIPIGLPRMDFLLDPLSGAAIRKEILEKYPQLDNGKKIIFYAPTFRKEDPDDMVGKAIDTVSRAVDYSRFNLIVKTHSGHERIYVDSHGNKGKGKFFEGMDFLRISDYVISDYSSIIFEASLARKPLYLYCFDWRSYLDDRGFYLDYFKDLPAVISEDIQVIMDRIQEGDSVPLEKVDQFARQYVQNYVPNVTATLAQIVDELARGAYDERYNYPKEL